MAPRKMKNVHVFKELDAWNSLSKKKYIAFILFLFLGYQVSQFLSDHGDFKRLQCL
jgi:hypothetical protein